MSSDSRHSAARESAQPAWAWVQTGMVLRIVFILLGVAVVLWVLYKLTTVILLVVLAIFLAYLLAPLVDLVQRPFRVGGRERMMPRGLAIAIVYLVAFSGIVVAIYFLAPQLAAQFPEFKQQATAYYKTISGYTDRLNQYFKQHRMPEGFVDAVNKTALGLIAQGGGIVSAAVERMLGLIIYLPWLVLIPILGFFFLKDADAFRRSALAMLPRGRIRWRGDEFFQDVNSTLAAYIRAQLTACLLVGVISSLGFWVIGLPSPLVLGIMSGMLEFVPLVGPLTVAILAVLLALLHSGWVMALVVLAFLGVMRVVEDYVIYPRIIGVGIHLHPLAVILAILAGAEIAGVAGIFLAIPVIAIITVSYRNWLEHRGSETLAEVFEVASDEPEPPPKRVRPTTMTTPADMERARPDLLTGEL